MEMVKWKLAWSIVAAFRGAHTSLQVHRQLDAVSAERVPCLEAEVRPLLWFHNPCPFLDRVGLSGFTTLALSWTVLAYPFHPPPHSRTTASHCVVHQMASLRQQLQHVQWTLDRTREAADKSQAAAGQLEEENRRLQQALLDTQADLALLEVRMRCTFIVVTSTHVGQGLHMVGVEPGAASLG